MNDLLMSEYFATPNSLATFTRNRHHIRVLQTKDPELLLYLVRQQPATLNSLLHLTFLDRLPYDFVERRLNEASAIKMTFTNFKALVSTLDKATNLRQLTINETCFWSKDKDRFLPLTAHLPAATLERLHISFDQPGQPIDANDSQLVNKLNQAILNCASHPPLIALKELRISVDTEHISIPRMAFLARCGSLERVRLDDVDDWFMRLMPSYFRRFCPRLMSLHLTERFGLEDEVIALMLRSSVSGWKELRLSRLTEFGLAFEALMESAATLEILAIDHWERLDK
ncbi:hypothetical protein BGW39_002813, partial [Mortierella sp. 14UC]